MGLNHTARLFYTTGGQRNATTTDSEGARRSAEALVRATVRTQTGGGPLLFTPAGLKESLQMYLSCWYISFTPSLHPPSF